MNGTYKVCISTPMGQQTGTISLVNKNGVLCGCIRALGNENPIKNGKANADAFTFEGCLKTVFGAIEYTAQGTIVGDLLQATAKTKYGTIQIKGTQIRAL